MTTASSSEHYVYLYRDNRGNPRYVGYGLRPSRATAHLGDSHNVQLMDFVKKQKFTIEVAGPFASEEIGRAIESVLISALNPDFNVVQGSSEARFRPLGVPVEFSSRLSQPKLQKNDFLLKQGDAPMPILFVFIGDQDFADGRVGYNPANPPSDEQVLERVEKWWQVRKLAQQWSISPNTSPGLLVGVHGGPGAQLIIASVKIDRSGWAKAELHPRGEGKIRIPVLDTAVLDAFNLRGRRIDRKAGIAFEAFPFGFYAILNTNGKLIGGRRVRRND